MYKFTINKESIIKLIPSFIVGMVGALIVQLWFVSHQRSTISTVNITGMVSSFVKETAKQNLSVNEQQKKVSQFGLTMQKVIDETANNRNTVIFPSEAVIAGSEDLTQEVVMRIKKEMN